MKPLLNYIGGDWRAAQTASTSPIIDPASGELLDVAAGIPSLLMGACLEDIASGIDETMIQRSSRRIC